MGLVASYQRAPNLQELTLSGAPLRAIGAHTLSRWSYTSQGVEIGFPAPSSLVYRVIGVAVRTRRITAKQMIKAHFEALRLYVPVKRTVIDWGT